MNTSKFNIFGILLLLTLLSCLGPKKNLFPPEENQPLYSVYIINQGWHSGIVFLRQEVPDSLWPAENDLPDSRFIEVGWGDADFYQAERNTVGLALKALFWPTASVLHVATFDQPITEYFRGYQIVEIKLSEGGYQQLCKFVQNSYARDASGRIQPLGKGLYGESRFYQARGNYFFGKTCNTWLAQAVRQAGCPITPAYACTATNVFYQLKKFGRPVPNKESR